MDTSLPILSDDCDNSSTDLDLDRYSYSSNDDKYSPMWCSSSKYDNDRQLSSSDEDELSDLLKFSNKRRKRRLRYGTSKFILINYLNESKGNHSQLDKLSLLQ